MISTRRARPARLRALGRDTPMIRTAARRTPAIGPWLDWLEQELVPARAAVRAKLAAADRRSGRGLTHVPCRSRASRGTAGRSMGRDRRRRGSQPRLDRADRRGRARATISSCTPASPSRAWMSRKRKRRWRCSMRLPHACREPPMRYIRGFREGAAAAAFEELIEAEVDPRTRLSSDGVLRRPYPRHLPLRRGGLTAR